MNTYGIYDEDLYDDSQVVQAKENIINKYL